MTPKKDVEKSKRAVERTEDFELPRIPEPSAVIGEVLDGFQLPPDEKQELKARLEARLEMVIGQYHSNLPPAFMLKEYKEVQEDLPERIIAMAERQAEHRQGMERKVVNGGSNRAYIGQGLGFVVAVFFGFLSYKLIMAGHGWAGSILASVDLVALVTVFIIGQTKQERETSQHDPTIADPTMLQKPAPEAG